MLFLFDQGISVSISVLVEVLSWKANRRGENQQMSLSVTFSSVCEVRSLGNNFYKASMQSHCQERSLILHSVPKMGKWEKRVKMLPSESSGVYFTPVATSVSPSLHFSSAVSKSLSVMMAQIVMCSCDVLM